MVLLDAARNAPRPTKPVKVAATGYIVRPNRFVIGAVFSSIMVTAGVCSAFAVLGI
jgi:hypothetical protein